MWDHRREQTTYYAARGNVISMLARQFDQANDVGYGEAYRCFTEYLGFEGEANASKVMSLAAYAGKADYLDAGPLFGSENDTVRCALRNYPPRPVAMLQEWALENNVRLPPQRTSSEAITDEHIQLARYIQNELEQSVLEEIRRLHRSTGITSLCLAGGVALNCVLNGKILTETPMKRLFVQPAAGDTGEAMGNALWGRSSLTASRSVHCLKPFLYLGKEYDLSYEAIRNLTHADYLTIEEPENVAGIAARLIADGNIVARFQGRSEFGPRALGNRSILADARFNGIAKRLAQCKGREYFRPFAPSVLADLADEVFDLADADYSHMSVTANAKPAYKPYIQGALHVDGSSRVQLVDASTNPKYHALLEHYFKLTGIPLILNTSFNRRGEPIVETPLDAIKAFRQVELDYLVVGDLLLSKTERLRNEPKATIEPLAVINLSGRTLEDDVRLEISRLFPSSSVSFRTVFGLYYEYWDWILNNRKHTTIRYAKGAIDFPTSLSMRVILSRQGLTPDRALGMSRENSVLVKQMKIKRFRDLDDDDARRDGFSGVRELSLALRKYYGPISDNEFVTIYEISPNTQVE